MTIHELTERPSQHLAQALSAFESIFTYPLGPNQTFRISHDPDYTRFLRSIGRSACFIAERHGSVLGTLGVAIRHLLNPDGEESLVAYFCDLKVANQATKGRVVWRLFQTAQSWLNNQSRCGFCIVMDGTDKTPDSYTDRLGFETFQPVSKVYICRIPVHEANVSLNSMNMIVAESEGLAIYSHLSHGRFATPIRSSGGRSELKPTWLATPDQSACGMLEDTRQAKRLFLSQGEELLSAHLSCFAYGSVNAGAKLLKKALAHCAIHEAPAMFVAVPEVELDSFYEMLKVPNILLAPATIYAHGLVSGKSWNINTAEV